MHSTETHGKVLVRHTLNSRIAQKMPCSPLSCFSTNVLLPPSNPHLLSFLFASVVLFVILSYKSQTCLHPQAMFFGGQGYFILTFLSPAPRTMDSTQQKPGKYLQNKCVHFLVSALPQCISFNVKLVQLLKCQSSPKPGGSVRHGDCSPKCLHFQLGFWTWHCSQATNDLISLLVISKNFENNHELGWPKNWDMQSLMTAKMFRVPDASLLDSINSFQNKVVCILIVFWNFYQQNMFID